MYVVAITRWARPFADELQALAPLLGMAVADARVRLAGPLPLVVGHVDEQQARELLEALRARGHGAVACDAARVPAGDAMFSPRAFELTPDAIVSELPGQPPARMPYAEILALVHAMHASESRTISTRTQKKFSASAAVISGGLKLNKQTKSTSYATSTEAEPVLYVIRRSGENAWLLHQGQLHYRGLGDHMAPTQQESFRNLVALLRQYAPGALYSDALLTQKRRPTELQQRHTHQQISKGKVEGSSVTQSNAGATDQAAHLIALAHLLGQG